MSKTHTFSLLAAFDVFIPEHVKSDPAAHLSMRAFIASRTACLVFGLAALPFCLAYYGMPYVADAALLSYFTIPAFALTRLATGARMKPTVSLSAFLVLGFAALFAGLEYGAGSALCLLLPLTCFELAMQGLSRRLFVCVGASAAIFAILGLFSISSGLDLSLLPLILAAASVGAFVQVIALAHPNTAKARQPAALQLADVIPDLVTLHSRNGNMLQASGALALLGPSAHKATTLFDLVHVHDRPAFLQLFSQMKDSDTSATLQYRLRDLNAETYSYVETRAVLVPENVRTMERQVVASTRVMQSQNIDEMQRLTEDAEKANMAKSRFLAHVSHELRTPLNAIIGFSEMLSGKAGIKVSDDKVLEYADLIQDSGRHLLAVVNAILDLSKIESGSFALHPEPFQPCELAAKCVTMMEPAAVKGGVALRVAQHGSLPEIMADRRACKQILLNLLSNAVKFTPKGGKVCVSLRCDSESVRFVVSDTGIGIDKADLPHLAQPFVQAQNSYDRQFEGTGLGLSLVKSLTELQGGTMRISSERHKGTIVTIILPRVVAASLDQHSDANVSHLKTAV